MYSSTPRAFLSAKIRDLSIDDFGIFKDANLLSLIMSMSVAHGS